MSRAIFHQLLTRYLAGECTAEEEELVNNWYSLLNRDDNEKLDESNLTHIENEIWERIKNNVDIGSSKPARRIGNGNPLKLNKWLLTAAASLALIIGIGVRYNLNNHSYPIAASFVSNSNEDDLDVVVVDNHLQKHQRVILPDESVVELSPGARITYPKSFKSSKREIILEGDAFFIVSASEHNPFWVYHEYMVTKVLGTQFKIKASTDESDLEVIVYQGNVTLYSACTPLVKRAFTKPELITARTNERVIVNEEFINETLIDNPLPIREEVYAITSQTYQDVPLHVLADKLSGLYAIRVEVDETLANVTFTGDLSGVGLYQQLDIINTVTGTQYDIDGRTILIKK